MHACLHANYKKYNVSDPSFESGLATAPLINEVRCPVRDNIYYLWSSACADIKHREQLCMIGRAACSVFNSDYLQAKLETLGPPSVNLHT